VTPPALLVGGARADHVGVPARSRGQPRRSPKRMSGSQRPTTGGSRRAGRRRAGSGRRRRRIAAGCAAPWRSAGWTAGARGPSAQRRPEREERGAGAAGGHRRSGRRVQPVGRSPRRAAPAAGTEEAVRAGGVAAVGPAEGGRRKDLQRALVEPRGRVGDGRATCCWACATVRRREAASCGALRKAPWLGLVAGRRG